MPVTSEKKSTAIPLLDLKAQYASIQPEVEAALKRVLESQHFILGPEVEALEQAIAAYSECNYGIGVSSGTDALLVALMVIDLQPGDEVITSSYSFFATAGAVARLKARPVFIDIDPLTYNLDAHQLESAITPRTRAIIPVHLYGQMADMGPIMDIAKRHNLTVIEDAAQAIGAEYKARRAGSIGHMACFSFFPSKNLGGIGDGGMVTTNDPVLADRLRLFRNHGYRPKYHNAVVGGNFRLDAIQAAVLLVKLRYLEGWTKARQQNALRYHQLFSIRKLKIASDSGDIKADGISLPTALPDRRHIYNQYVIRLRQRDELLAYLQQHQIGCEVYYPVPLHLQQCFADLGYIEGNFPVSEWAAQTTLAIPIYPELTPEMQSTVVDTIARFMAMQQETGG